MIIQKLNIYESLFNYPWTFTNFSFSTTEYGEMSCDPKTYHRSHPDYNCYSCHPEIIHMTSTIKPNNYVISLRRASYEMGCQLFRSCFSGTIINTSNIQMVFFSRHLRTATILQQRIEWDLKLIWRTMIFLRLNLSCTGPF